MTGRAPFRPNGLDALPAMRMLRLGWAALRSCRPWSSALALCFGVLLAAPAVAQVSVSAGNTIYNNDAQIHAGSPKCATAGCHTGPLDTNFPNHSLASNNPDRILIPQLVGGGMEFTFNPDPNANQRFSLALYIGQFKAPIAGNATLVTHAGFGKSIDVYPLLTANGTGGAPQDTSGITASNPTNGSTAVSRVGSSAAAFAYNVTYTPDAGFVGSENFTYTATNPTGSDNGTVSVTVVGITSGSASIRTDVPGSYQITTNCSTGCTPSTPYSLTGALPSGMSFSTSTGQISGTPASTTAASYPITIGASTTIGGVTRLSTKAVTLTAVGVSSAGTASATQGAAFSYAITTNGTPSGAFPYSASGLPSGLSIDQGSGVVSGVPANGGSAVVTIGVVTTLGPVSKTLTITTTFAGAPTVTTAPAAPSGSVGAAYPSVQINATNPPISSYGASGLPPGLTVNTATGAITGTPTTSGVFVASLSATNGASGGGTGSASVSFTVLPNAVPVITPPGTTTTAQGSPYSATLVASNPPITGYGGSSLPPGLSVNPSTGAITGTPTTSGVFNASLSATNVVGTANLPVSFTILPTSVPVIASPITLSGTAGVAMTPVSLVASNPPVTGYAGSNLPVGVTVDALTGQISGTPATPGTYGVTLSATNNAGTGQVGVVFTVGALPPAAGSAALAVPLNGIGSIDLATAVTGFGITGVAIVTPPTKGTVGVGGTVATYRPNTDYFGVDSFSYVAFGAGGTSSTGTVSITVTGRPDPLRNAAVTGLVSGQAETARRFARTQVTNFQRRLDFLHRPAGRAASTPSTGSLAASAAPAAASAMPAPSAPAPVSNNDRALASAWNGVISTPAVAGARSVPESTSESLAASSMASSGQGPGSAEAALNQFVQAATRSLGPNGVSTAMVTGAVELATQRRLDLSALTGKLAAPESGGVGVWAGGSVDFGKRPGDATQGESSFSTTGISAGADRRVSENLIVGVGLGYARNESDIGNDGSESIGRGSSFAVYASYQPGDAFFDGLLGFVSLAYDNSRFVTAEDAFAKSERSGRQLFATLSAGYALHSDGFRVTPYGRIELSSDRIDGATETGVGASALSYGEQSGSSLAGALGLRVESTHPTKFGWITPRVRLEFRREADRTDSTAISYADLPGSPFVLGADRRSRNARLFGVGAEIETRSGTRFGIDYLLQSSDELRRGESLMLTVSSEFGGSGIRRSPDDTVLKPLGFRVEAGFTYDDNIARSRDRADRISDQTTALSLAKGKTITLTPNTRLWLNGSLAGERSHHFEGLDRVTANGIAEVQYRTSGAFDASTFALSVRVSGDEYRSELRDGFRGGASVSMQQALTDRIGLFGAVTANRRDARSAVFDTADRAVRVNADYALDGGDTLYLGGELRRGTVVSSGRPSLEDITIAEVIAPDDAYPGRSFFAYRVDARTVIATLGYNLRFGVRDSLDLSVRRVVSTPTDRPSWASSDDSYVAHQISVFYLTRF